MTEELFPIEKLMLLHFKKKGPVPLDMADAVGAFNCLIFGHKKWLNAQYCMAFMALEGLKKKELVTWKGQSRALGHQGWHGGLWKITDKGKDVIKELTGDA